MTNEEAKKRIEIQLRCMECDENTLCYGNDLVTICDVYDDSVRLSLKEALNVAIKALSVEPQEGEWLPPDEFFDTKIWRKCSKCGINIDLHPKYISFGGEVHYSNRVSNYCPKCGAKMESEDT